MPEFFPSRAVRLLAIIATWQLPVETEELPLLICEQLELGDHHLQHCCQRLVTGRSFKDSEDSLYQKNPSLLASGEVKKLTWLLILVGERQSSLAL